MSAAEDDGLEEVFLTDRALTMGIRRARVRMLSDRLAAHCGRAFGPELWHRDLDDARAAARRQAREYLVWLEAERSRTWDVIMRGWDESPPEAP